MFLFVSGLTVSGPMVRAEDNDESESSFEWVVLPNTEANTDRGVGGGAIAHLYWYQPGIEPFRDRVEASTVLTTTLYQDHFVTWERLGIHGGKLRIKNTIGFLAIRDQTYCGLGNSTQCDVATAERAGEAAGLVAGTADYTDFVRDYYRIRAMRPYLTSIIRWKPQRQRPWFELYGSWRGIVERSGFFGERGPYRGSLFAEQFADGQQEVHQALEFGVLIDQRNSEVRPSSGWLVGAFARAALRLGNETQTYGGATVVGASYRRVGKPLGLTHWVWASRVIVDVIRGSAPIREFSKVGGLWRVTSFGGTVGRGIRSDRFAGGFKLLGQTEIRSGEIPLYRGIRLSGQAFVDVGWVGVSLTDFGGSPGRVRSGFGVGPAISWGRSFVARLDIGVSRSEDFQPFFYVGLGHPY